MRRLLSDSSSQVGWGRKPSGRRCVRKAQQLGQKYYLLEDGFLRSVDREDYALSIVFDDEGIYYDATTPSRLERLIQQELTAEQLVRTKKLIQRWRELRLSKYNAAREYGGELPERYVLVADQVANDLSIEYGLADQTSFNRMLIAALDENPDSTVIVKVHPDILTRQKAGHFDIQALGEIPRIKVIAENCHPVRLIEKAEAVYCVTSQVGFEALIHGRPVRSFGMPFYAGWGLTQDELPKPRRRDIASLEQLVHAALVDYPHYLDPKSKIVCEPERIFEHVGFQHGMIKRFPAKLYALGFSRWKEAFVRLFFQGSEITFVKQSEQIPAGAAVLIWGRSKPEEMPSDCTFLHVEDGFLRSSLIGGALVRPLSLVIDDLGIYYDQSKPSRLEQMLQERTIDDALKIRASRLREKLVQEHIGKYNLGSSGWKRPVNADHVILVPGQVEEDASIRFGAPLGASNLGLLKTVRDNNPEAYIVYKPHPDVVEGMRKMGAGEKDTSNWCNEVISSGDAIELFSQIDEVHVLTSLAGFEALLRGLPVTCHGTPFYAGWGLTTDLHQNSRRTRKRTLDELVAAVLILYPTYVSSVSDAFTTPEKAIEELIEWRDTGATHLSVWRKLQRTMILLKRIFEQ